MKKTCMLLTLLIVAISFSQVTPQNNLILPDNFSDKVFEHIEFLSGLDHRQVGSENDSVTMEYIREKFEEMKIDIEIQPFQFESFEYTNASLLIDRRSFNVMGLGLNPYSGSIPFSGKATILDWNGTENYPLENIKGKVIITNDWFAHFTLLRYQPELIIYLDKKEFVQLGKEMEIDFQLKIDGHTEKFRSANIVAQIGKSRPGAKEILITAHYDTYRKNNPGASDNASGVGVLIELARYFKQIENELNCVLKFIAFSGEECGVVGSRHYLHNNYQSLEKCELLFNIDDVGGHRSIVVERNGGYSTKDIEGLSQTPEYIKYFPWEGINSYWRILPDMEMLKIFGAGNHPVGLKSVIDKSIDELGYEVKFTGTQGSDQLPFAHAGIVTSGVGIIGDHFHTPEDKPEHINKESLRKAGEIAAHVVLNTIEKIYGAE